MSEHVSGGTRELMNFQKFKWGKPNTGLTLVEWHQPEQLPPACRVQPRCGNYSHFYCGNGEKKKKIPISWCHLRAADFRINTYHIKCLWRKFTLSCTCGSAAQTEQFCVCPLTVAPWSADLPTAAKRSKIQHINHHYVKKGRSQHIIFFHNLTSRKERSNWNSFCTFRTVAHKWPSEYHLVGHGSIGNASGGIIYKANYA